MIELKKTTKTYQTKAGTIQALLGVDLKFDDTGMVFVLGRSGSGKSTLLHLIGALDAPDSGEIIIDGQSTAEYSQADYDHLRNHKIGFVFQEYNLLDELNVAENIALALELQGLEKNDEKIDAVLTDVGLSDYADRKVNTLSGGQKQRVAIARALVKNPTIILADEPTGALDSETGYELYVLLKKLSKKMLVVVVSHDRDATAEFADRVVSLKDGKISIDQNMIIDQQKIADNVQSLDKVDNVQSLDKLEMKKALSDDSAIEQKVDYICVENKENISETNSLKKNVVNFTDEKALDLHIKNGSSIASPKCILHKRKNKGLSFASTFKLGIQMFFSKPLRLVISIILCAFAFFGLGMAINIASYNKVNTAVRSLNGSANYISYMKETYNEENDSWDSAKSASPDSDRSEVYLSDEDIDKIKERLGGTTEVVGILPLGNMTRHEVDISSELIGSADYIYLNGTTYLSEEMTNQMGFTVCGRLPQNSDEVAITEYAYQLYKKIGYYQTVYVLPAYFTDNNTYETVEINSHADLIGKKLDFMTNEFGITQSFIICGIVDTGFDFNQYSPLYDKKEADWDISEWRLLGKLKGEMGSGWHALTFVNEEIMSQQKSEYAYALMSMPTSQKGIVNAVKLGFEEHNGVRFSLYNYVSQQIDQADMAMNIGKEVALYAGLIVGVFAVLLLANYVSSTISVKKRTIGIIRALGGGSREVLKIVVVQSVLVALCVFVVTMIFSFVGVGVMSMLFKRIIGLSIKIIYVDLVQVAIILGLSLVASILASAIPVYLMTRKKPIDIIKF